jgi:hypothetical protein
VLGDQLGRELEVEIAEGKDALGVGNLRHALEGRTDPFQVKKAVLSHGRGNPALCVCRAMK